MLLRLTLTVLLLSARCGQDIPDTNRQTPAYSVDSLFYEDKRLVRCEIVRTNAASEESLLPDDRQSFPAIVYFYETVDASSPSPQHRTNTFVLTIILSGYFTKLELSVQLAGLDSVKHNWQGKGTAIAIHRSNIFSSRVREVQLTYFVDQNHMSLQLPTEQLTVDLKHVSATSHFSIIRLVAVLAASLLLIVATKDFERMGVIASQISTVSLSALFAKMTLELAFICIDNFAFNKPLQSQYLDIFVMIFEFLVVAYASLLLFPTCGTFLRWRLMLWLAVVLTLELLFTGKRWYNILTCAIILLPQVRFNVRESGSLKSGDKVMLLLYLYYYGSVLGFAAFDDNYLYFWCSRTVLWVMVAIVLINV